VELPKYNLFSILVFSRRAKRKTPALRRRTSEVTVKPFCILILTLVLVPSGPSGLHAQNNEHKKVNPAFRQEDMLNTIKRLEDDMRVAILKGDTGWWSAYLSDEYTQTEADGKVKNKAQAIEALRSKYLIYDTLNFSDRAVRTFNGDTVLITGKMTVEGTDQGKTMNGDFQFTRVWVKQGLEWKLASFQMTSTAQ
jgi:ketosteroid isomerase-like protein